MSRMPERYVAALESERILCSPLSSHSCFYPNKRDMNRTPSLLSASLIKAEKRIMTIPWWWSGSLAWNPPVKGPKSLLLLSFYPEATRWASQKKKRKGYQFESELEKEKPFDVSYKAQEDTCNLPP